MYVCVLCIRCSSDSDLDVSAMYPGLIVDKFKHFASQKEQEFLLQVDIRACVCICVYVRTVKLAW